MDFYDFKVGASGVFEMNVQGDYIYYLEGSVGMAGADNSIVIQDQSGNRIPLKPGQAAKLGRSSQFDTKWYLVSRKKQGEITGTVLIGDADDFTDNRISGSVEIVGIVGVQGVVETVDSAKKRTLDSMAFIMGSSQVGVVNEYSHVQLFNAGASRRLIVESLAISADAAVSCGIGFHNAPIATLVGAAKTKLAGGANSAHASVRVQSNAAMLSAGQFSSFLADTVQFKREFKTPIVLPPNTGLICYTGGTGRTLSGEFEFYEEAII